QSVDLRLELRHSHWWAGELGKLFSSLREAERLARTLGDQRRLGRVWVWIGQYLLVTGDSSQARAYAQNAENIGVYLGDVWLTAGARYILGWACHTAGDFLRAEYFLRKVVQGGQGLDANPQPGSGLVEGLPRMARLSVASRWSLAVPLGERGAFDDAITQAQE